MIGRDQKREAIGEWLEPHVAARRLRLSTNSLLRAAYYGAIPIEPVDEEDWRLLIDRDCNSGKAIYDAFVAKVTKWDYDQALAHRQVRIALDIPAAQPWPVELDHFLLRLLGEDGLICANLHIFCPSNNLVASEHVKRLAAIANCDRPAPSRHRPATCDLGAVLAEYPSLRLPNTCATNPDTPAPDEKWLGTAFRRRHCAELACAALLICDDGTTENAACIGKAFEILDEKLEGFGACHPLTDCRLLSALQSILDDAEIKQIGKDQRLCAVMFVLGSLQKMALYAARHDGALARFASLLDRKIYDHFDVRRRLGRLQRKRVLECQRNRKSEAEQITDRLHEFRVAIRIRTQQAMICAEGLSDARSSALEHFAMYDGGDDATPFYEIHIPIPGLGTDACPTYTTQVTGWRIWREEDYLASLAVEPDTFANHSGLSDRQRHSLARQSGIFPKNSRSGQADATDASLITEYIGSVADGSVNAVEPHFVTIARLGMLDAAKSSSQSVFYAQRAFAAAHQLGISESLTIPNGLAGNDSIHRWSRRVGRCAIPVGQITLAMRIAHCNADIICDSLAREVEVRQIVQTPACLSNKLGPTQSSPGFRAVPKGQKGSKDFLLSMTTLEECLDLARDLAHFHDLEEGYLPNVPATDALRKKCPKAAPFLFQWEGQALSGSAMRYLLALLGAGFGRVTPHLLRHAASNYYRTEGLQERAVQHLLNHKSLALTEYYMTSTPKQIAERQIEKNEKQRKLVRDAERRSGPVG